MAPPAVAVVLRTMTGATHELTLNAPVHVGVLYARAGAALQLPPDKFKLVLRGSAITHASAAAEARAAGGGGGDSSGASSSGGLGLLGRRPGGSRDPVVPLSDGDVLLVVPQRKAPTERLQRVAAEASGVELPDDDDAVRFALRPGAPAWEAWLARFLQERCRAPELLLVWLFHIRPGRLAAAAAVIAGARLAAAYELGPIYILLAIIVAIFTHLGTKQEGEASAYSVFNPGVRALPGQLDAGQLDEQIRRGQLG